MKLLVFITVVWRIFQIVHKLSTQVNVDFAKGTAAVYESFKVLVHVLPLYTLFLGLLFKVLQEVSIELVLVEEVETLIHDRFISSASHGFGFFHHTLVELLLTLVGRIGISVDAQRLVLDYLHGCLITIARVESQIVDCCVPSFIGRLYNATVLQFIFEKTGSLSKF